MPEFAKGWETDGWVSDSLGYTNTVEHNTELGNHWLRFVLYDCGELDLIIGDDSGDEQIVTFNYGDPLIAKQKAEQLMEGL